MLPSLRKASHRPHPDNIDNNSSQILNKIKILKERLESQNKNANVFPAIKLYRKGNVSNFCELSSNNLNTNITIHGNKKECEELREGTQFTAYKIENVNGKNWIYKKSRSSKRKPQNLNGHYIQEYLNGDSWKTLSDLSMNEFEHSLDKICEELLRVYKFFYKKGIRHNDFHLSNILFNTRDGKMKIIDYDLMTFQKDGNTDPFSINKYLDWYKISALPKNGTPDTIYIMGTNEDQNLNNRPGMNPTLKKKYVMIRNKLKPKNT